MGDNSAVNDVVECKVKGVATLGVWLVRGGRDGMWGRTAEAVASRAKLGDSLLFESGNDFVEGWASLVGAMVGEPCPQVECARLRVYGLECGM